MTQHCSICDKTRNRAWRLLKLRGKYNPTTKRTQKPNLQWLALSPAIAARFHFPLSLKRVKACTKCIKSLGKKTSRAKTKIPQ